MLDEGSEDNELAPLEPVVERAGQTSTCFAYSTFCSRLVGATSGCCAEEDENECTFSKQRVDELIRV